MIRRFIVPLALAGTAVLAACSGSPGPTDTVPPSETAAPLVADPSTSRPSDDNKRAERREKGPRGHRGGGPMGVLFETAIRDLDLPETKVATLRQIKEDLKAGRDDHEASHDIDKKLEVALRSGSIDAASIKAQIDAVEKGSNEGFNAHVAALDKLHATLDASERQALVEKVRAKKPNEPPQGLPPDGKMRGGKMRGPMGGPMLDGLDLTDAQKKSLEAALGPKPSETEMRAKFEEHRTRMDKVLTEFAKDGFQASRILTANEGSKHKAEHLRKKLALTQAALTVLNDDQREKLADRMQRKGPPRPRD